MSVADTDSPISKRFGRWVLERRLGEGGFGSAWLARDPHGEVAVVKLLSAPPGDEIRALARIRHPAVVPALGAGVNPRPYLVLGFAPGRPLGTGDRLPTTEALTALAILADALAACHDAGVAHGDIKPDNVMYDSPTGRVTVIDFGLVGSEGGTPRYAAPERPGTGATPAADVYAWGLVAWEVLAGRLPWPDDAPFTDRSAPAVPKLPEELAPEGIRELVHASLRPDPSARPTAAAVVDACEALGVALPERSASEVTRRARGVFVDRPGVTAAIDAWLTEGGSLVLVGPRGSGRTHALDRVANELQARGLPFARLYPADQPWGGIEAALADPSLPGESVALPIAADPISRAEVAAEQLAGRVDPTDARQLVVLVHDHEDLDEGTRRCVEALRRLGAAVLATATRCPPPFERVATLDPFDRGQIATLVERTLGTVDARVVDATLAASSGLPRDAAAFLAAAVASEALLYRRRAWVVVPERLEEHSATWVAGALPPTTGLSEAACNLGALVALAAPVDRADALEVAEADDADLDALVAAGLVRGGAPLQCVGAAAVAALAAVDADRERLAGVLVERWLRRETSPLARIGPLLVVAGDVDAIAEHGPACVAALAARNVDRAVDLVSALFARHPSRELAVSHSRALLQAGRIDEAREAGVAALGSEPYGLDDVPILTALARLEGVAADPEARTRWIEVAVAACGDTAPPAELRLERAQAALASGDTARAEDDCLAVGVEPSEDDPAIWLRARRMLAQVREHDEGPAAGLTVLDDIPEGVGEGTRERALIEGDRGRLLWHVGKPRAAAAAMERTAAFRRALPLVDRARLENNAGLGWYSAGDLVKAVACWERALLAFERIGAPRDASFTRVNLCQGYRELGRWARAETIGQTALAWAREAAARTNEAMLLGNLGDVALWQHKYDLAEQRYDEAQSVAEAVAGGELTSELVELARRRCELGGLRGDDAWVTDLDTAEALTKAAEARDEVARVRAMRALAEARDGRQHEAEASIAAAIEELRALGATGELAVARLWVGEAWLELGYPERATEEAQAVVRYAEEFVRPPLGTWARDLLERARPDRSVGHVERLTEVAVRVSMHEGLPDILTSLAEAAVELVEVDRALVVLEGPDGVEIVAEAGGRLRDPPSMSIVQRVLQTGREVVSGDLEERGDLRGNASVVAMNLRSAMCMPLVVEGEVLGALYLDSRGVPGGDLWEAASLARGLAAHGAVALRNAHLADQLEQRATDAEGAHRFADALLRAVPTPVVIAAEDGTTVDANDAAITMLGGASRDDLPRRLPDCLDRLEGGLAEEYQLHVPRLRRAVPVRVRRAQVETPDGRHRTVFALADLTPRIAAEVQQMRAIAAAREASSAKDRFLASMSHELRTPLNAIIGYTELIVEDVPESEALADLGRILAAGRHLLGLVDDVLDISRIESGRLQLNIEEKPVDEVFEEVASLVRPSILERGATFDVEFRGDLGVARTDHLRVRQICTNLLDNAVQHSGGRSVGFFVRGDVALISVEVRDDGVGIAPERVEGLFAPFVQFGAPPRAGSGGVGLGLSIARRLSEQLGGDLTVVSTVGVGTTFRFTFKRRIDPSP